MIPIAEPRGYEQADRLRRAMRNAAGSVYVVSSGFGENRTGLTVTSAVSLSLDPPTMLVCVNQSASALPTIRREGSFAVNILSSEQQDVAERFAGRHGCKGADRYNGAFWRRLRTGSLGLEGAIAVVECVVDEIIDRHSHSIILGAVMSVTSGGCENNRPLLYVDGLFKALSVEPGKGAEVRSSQAVPR